MKQKIRRIGTDVLGGFLILLAGAVGWLPGPAGIPLLIAGLSLLAINHDWAARLLIRAKKGGVDISAKIFSEHPIARIIIDICSVVLITAAVLLLNYVTKNFLRSLSIAMFFLGITLLLGNRKRLERFLDRVKRR